MPTRLIPVLTSLIACNQAPPPPAEVADVEPAAQADSAAESAAEAAFSPPKPGAYPEGELGEAVRRGEALFNDVQTHAPEYSGNRLSCRNCHLDGGRQADAAPLWGAYVRFPAYRGKNHHVNDFDERLRGCFTYSMNAQDSPKGQAPPPGDPVILDLEAYAFWLSQGAAVGADLPGRGFPKLERPADVSADRGAALYKEHCTACHGPEGKGVVAAGKSVFPPLWGPDSYNWGAGMHERDKAAGFIYANMPLGQPRSLTPAQAWDLAAFIDAQDRPADPRDADGVAATDKAHHDHDCAYGDTHGDHVLGQR